MNVYLSLVAAGAVVTALQHGLEGDIFTDEDGEFDQAQVDAAADLMQKLSLALLRAKEGRLVEGNAPHEGDEVML